MPNTRQGMYTPPVPRLRAHQIQIHQYYRLKYKEDEETQKTFKFAEQNFAQMYFIRNYASDKSRVEMSFNLTNCEASGAFHPLSLHPCSDV